MRCTRMSWEKPDAGSQIGVKVLSLQGGGKV